MIRLSSSAGNSPTITAGQIQSMISRMAGDEFTASPPQTIQTFPFFMWIDHIFHPRDLFVNVSWMYARLLNAVMTPNHLSTLDTLTLLGAAGF